MHFKLVVVNNIVKCHVYYYLLEVASKNHQKEH